LELKNKIQEEALLRKVSAATDPPRRAAPPPDELVDALLALGYRRAEAENAASAARESAADVQDQLRVALRALRR
jgi:Holliday junction resolvasome RuvABC DNA-binding subunit